MPSQCELNLLKVGNKKKRKVKQRRHRWLKRINYAGFVGKWQYRQCSMAVLNSRSRGHRHETRAVIALAMYSLASWYIESSLDKLPSNCSSLASIGCFYATRQHQFSVCYIKPHLSNVFKFEQKPFFTYIKNLIMWEWKQFIKYDFFVCWGWSIPRMFS